MKESILETAVHGLTGGIVQPSETSSGAASDSKTEHSGSTGSESAKK